jgi:hypothetical protein
MVSLFALPPIAQDPAYHRFADDRVMFGIANFLNVASNAPFLLLGVAGLATCRRGMTARPAWVTFFTGTALVAAGSAWYHLDPDDASLALDRWPMTIGFMGLVSAIVTEHLRLRSCHWLLWPSLCIGLASVAWWRLSGDLRLYAWVQFAPLLLTLLILWIYPAPFTNRAYLGWALACYVLAKLTEWMDVAIYSWTNHIVSGHTLKHLAAAAGVACVWLMLRQRQPLAANAVTG